MDFSGLIEVKQQIGKDPLQNTSRKASAPPASLWFALSIFHHPIFRRQLLQVQHVHARALKATDTTTPLELPLARIDSRKLTGQKRWGPPHRHLQCWTARWGSTRSRDVVWGVCVRRVHRAGAASTRRGAAPRWASPSASSVPGEARRAHAMWFGACVCAGCIMPVSRRPAACNDAHVLIFLNSHS
jgi:hypothetical protein